MFDYSNVTPILFEYIAREYLEENYPGIWELTSATNDGNRDIVCSFSFYDNEFEIWAEAKFSKSPDSTKLSKGQLDPTLISAMLYPKPVSVKFISNTNVSDSYIYRLTDFKIKTNIGVTLILKEEFEKWLNKRSDICSKYGIEKRKQKDTVEIINTNTFDVSGAIITETIDSNSIVQNLTVGELYFLYLVINSEISYENVYLKFITKGFEFINNSSILNDSKSLSIPFGKSGYKFCFVPTIEYQGSPEVAVCLGERILTRFKLPKIYAKNTQNRTIAYAQQNKIEADIFSIVNQNVRTNRIIALLGPGATGKSHLALNLQKSFSLNYDTMSFAFSDSNYFNCKQLCNIILFLNIGNTEGYSWDSIEVAVNNIKIFEMRVFLSEALTQIKKNPEQFIEIISQERFALGKQLLFNQHSIQKKVLLVEDVHKLKGQAKKVFTSLIKQFTKFENQYIFIYTKRSNELNSINHEYIGRLQGLSKADKIATLSYYFDEIPQNIYFDRTTDNLLFFSNIINKLLEKNNNDPLFMKSLILKLCEHNDSQDVNAFYPHILGYKKYYDLIELVFFIETGINYILLCTLFSNKKIDYLINQKIFKLVSGYVFPFHEYYVKAYKQKHEISVQTLDRINVLLEKDPDNTVQYLKLLLEGGNTYFFSQIDRARKMRDKYFSATQFFESYLLSQAIVDKIDFDEKLSEEEVYDVYTLASSSFYQKSGDDVVQLYNIVLEEGEKYKYSSKMRGVLFRTITELANQFYWNFEHKKINQIFALIEQEFPKGNLSDDFQIKFACVHRYNRHMVWNMLMNNYDIAQKDYNNCIIESNRLALSNSIGFAEMDFGKGLYIKSPHEAYVHMNNACKTFEKSNTEYRRYLDCKCEVAYLDCLIYGYTPQNVYNLEKSANLLFEAHFVEIFAKAKLKLAAINMCSSNPNLKKVEELIVESEYVLTYQPRKRFRMLLANIKSVYYILTGQHQYASIECKKYVEITNDLGEDYKKIALHNLRIKNSSRAEFCFQRFYSNDVALVDPRIW